MNSTPPGLQLFVEPLVRRFEMPDSTDTFTASSDMTNAPSRPPRYSRGRSRSTQPRELTIEFSWRWSPMRGRASTILSVPSSPG